MKSPFFSIILPTFNREKFISKAIESIINQEYKNWELIIIDDGSTDNTKEIVSPFLNSKIKYFYQENQERSIARNNGMSKANGQYICFLDSDDYYLPNHLNTLYENISNKNFPIALFHTYQIYKKEDKEIKSNYKDNYQNSKLSKKELSLINNVWLFSPPVQTIAIHKEIASKIKFDIFEYYVAECYDFIGEIASNFDIHKIGEQTITMQLHEDNSTLYNHKFLKGSEISFEYIISKEIYKSIKNHKSVKQKFYNIYIGLADYYSSVKNKKGSIQYLKKALKNKTDLKNIRQILGVIKNILLK